MRNKKEFEPICRVMKDILVKKVVASSGLVTSRWLHCHFPTWLDSKHGKDYEGPGTERHIHHGLHDSKKHPEINTDHSIVENLRQLAGADIGLAPHLASL